MGPFDREYQQQANYCMRMADRAPSDELRQDWLRLAGKWLRMITDSKSHSPQASCRVPQKRPEPTAA